MGIVITIRVDTGVTARDLNNSSRNRSRKILTGLARVETGIAKF